MSFFVLVTELTEYFTISFVSHENHTIEIVLTAKMNMLLFFGKISRCYLSHQIQTVPILRIMIDKASLHGSDHLHSLSIFTFL